MRCVKSAVEVNGVMANPVQAYALAGGGGVGNHDCGPLLSSVEQFRFYLRVFRHHLCITGINAPMNKYRAKIGKAFGDIFDIADKADDPDEHFFALSSELPSPPFLGRI